MVLRVILGLILFSSGAWATGTNLMVIAPSNTITYAQWKANQPHGDPGFLAHLDEIRYRQIQAQLAMSSETRDYNNYLNDIDYAHYVKGDAQDSYLALLNLYNLLNMPLLKILSVLEFSIDQEPSPADRLAYDVHRSLTEFEKKDAARNALKMYKKLSPESKLRLARDPMGLYALLYAKTVHIDIEPSIIKDSQVVAAGSSKEYVSFVQEDLAPLLSGLRSLRTGSNSDFGFDPMLFGGYSGIASSRMDYLNLSEKAGGLLAVNSTLNGGCGPQIDKALK